MTSLAKFQFSHHTDCTGAIRVSFAGRRVTMAKFVCHVDPLTRFSKFISFVCCTESLCRRKNNDKKENDHKQMEVKKGDCLSLDLPYAPLAIRAWGNLQF